VSVTSIPSKQHTAEDGERPKSSEEMEEDVDDSDHGADPDDGTLVLPEPFRNSAAAGGGRENRSVAAVGAGVARPGRALPQRRHLVAGTRLSRSPVRR